MSDHTKATIEASIIDGIAWTPRFRERNLVALHNALEQGRVELLEASTAAGMTDAEASFQYLLALNVIKIFHTTVHPQTCKETEYRVAKSKDHLEQRRPHGYVYVTASSVCDFYSIINAVAAAICAGNCVIVQRAKQSTRLSTTIEQHLTEALSHEAFAFVTEDPFDPTFQARHRVVLLPDHSAKPDLAGASVRGYSGSSVAIVDRTGDPKAAARDLVHARFAFCGKSAYAPDLVLVNDFCVEQFISAVAEAALQYLTGDATGVAQSLPQPSSKVQDLRLARLEEAGTVIASGHAGKVVLLRERNENLLKQKIRSPVLLVLPVTSVDDAIDFLNMSSQDMLAAACIYSSPDFAKYISQFVRTSLSLVNHIPPQLLVGPPSPLSVATSIHPRYTPEMFSIASPTLIERQSQSRALHNTIWHGSDKSQAERLRALNDSVETTLKPVKEPFGPAIGFFEQGFLYGAGLFLSTVIIGSMVSLKYAYPFLVHVLRR